MSKLYTTFTLGCNYPVRMRIKHTQGVKYAELFTQVRKLYVCVFVYSVAVRVKCDGVFTWGCDILCLGWVKCMQVCLSLSCLTEGTILNIECPINCKEAYKGKLNEDVNNLCWQAKGVSKLHCGPEDVTIQESSITQRCNITFGPCSKMWLNFTVWGLPARTNSFLFCYGSHQFWHATLELMYRVFSKGC